MQIIRDHNRVPPGGWRYTDPTFGRRFDAPNPHILIQRIVDHYHTHNKVPPTDLALIVDTQICEQLPDMDRFCRDTPKPTWKHKVMKASQALLNWVDRGFKLVTAEQLAERQKICEQCPHWNGTVMLGAGACRACGCTGLKLAAIDERCPARKWPEII